MRGGGGGYSDKIEILRELHKSRNAGTTALRFPAGNLHLTPVADPENFGGGGFEAQNLKNSDVFTKIENDFSAEIGNSNVFFAQIQVVSKKKKKKGLRQN